VLASLNVQIKMLEAQIAAQLAPHPDGPVFTSLPRSGTVRAARLLSEIRDCRARFPDPQSLQAGTGLNTGQCPPRESATRARAYRKVM
jgi:transposase